MVGHDDIMGNVNIVIGMIDILDGAFHNFPIGRKGNTGCVEDAAPYMGGGHSVGVGGGLWGDFAQNAGFFVGADGDEIGAVLTVIVVLEAEGFALFLFHALYSLRWEKTADPFGVGGL